MLNAIVATLVDTVNRIILFIPQLISGFIILAIGWGFASLLRYLAKKAFDLLPVEQLLARVGMDGKRSTGIWSEIVSQVVFWFVFIAFLIPAFDAWQLANVTNLLNQILFYIPSVLAAVIIGFIGYILANVAYNLVKNATGKSQAASLLGNVAKYSLYVFTALVVLNQLQIASNLIQLLLGGFVAMAALAGGLAFGLGGQDTARELLGRLMGRKPGQRSQSMEEREIKRVPVYASQIRFNKKESLNKQEKESAENKEQK